MSGYSNQETPLPQMFATMPGGNGEGDSSWNLPSNPSPSDDNAATNRSVPFQSTAVSPPPTPEHNATCSCGMKFDSNTITEQDIAMVLEECRNVSLRMISRVVTLYLMLFAVLLWQALCIWSSDRVYGFYSNAVHVVPSFEGERVNWQMSPLYDHIQVGFMRWFKNGGFSIRYADTLIAVLFVVVGCKFVVFAPVISGLQMLCRYVWIMSQLYFLRGLFIVATVVPSASANCATFKGTDTVWAQLWHVIQGYFSITETCTDMILSGHTASSTVVVQMFVLHNSLWQLQPLAIIAGVAIYLLLILCKAHYTIDVMFGVLFGLQMYSNHLRMVSRVGRCLYKGVELGTSLFSRLSRLVAKVELVEERVRLSIALMHIKLATADHETYYAEDLAFYYDIFGIEDDMELRRVYRGFNDWSSVNLRLIARLVRRWVTRRRAARHTAAQKRADRLSGPHPDRPDDTPSTNPVNFIV